MQIDEIDYGRLAKDVLDNPVYQDAFDRIKKELYSQWQNSENLQEREALHLSNKLLGKMQAVFKQAVMNGEVELRVWEHKKTLAEKIGIKYPFV